MCFKIIWMDDRNEPSHKEGTFSECYAQRHQARDGKWKIVRTGEKPVAMAQSKNWGEPLRPL